MVPTARAARGGGGGGGHVVVGPLAVVVRDRLLAAERHSGVKEAETRAFWQGVGDALAGRCPCDDARFSAAQVARHVCKQHSVRVDVPVPPGTDAVDQVAREQVVVAQRPAVGDEGRSREGCGGGGEAAGRAEGGHAAQMGCRALPCRVIAPDRAYSTSSNRLALVRLRGVRVEALWGKDRHSTAGLQPPSKIGLFLGAAHHR